MDEHYYNLSHCVLYQQSPTPSIFCSCSPFSSHSLQISLNGVLSSHSRSSSPPSPPLPANVSTPILSTCPSHFSLLLTSFFLKLSFPPTSTLSSSRLLSSAPTHSQHSSYPVVFSSQTRTFCCFSLSAIHICRSTTRGSTFPLSLPNIHLCPITRRLILL